MSGPVMALPYHAEKGIFQYYFVIPATDFLQSSAFSHTLALRGVGLNYQFH
jgi:hypothetical protein